jgi:hypothetical protein
MKPSILLLMSQSRQVTDAIGGLISLVDLVRLPDLGSLPRPVSLFFTFKWSLAL